MTTSPSRPAIPTLPRRASASASLCLTISTRYSSHCRTVLPRRPCLTGGRGQDGHRPGSRLQAARSCRLPALVRLRTSSTRPPGAGRLRHPGASPRRAGGTGRFGRAHRGGSRLLPDDNAAGPGSPRPGGVDRRRRRGRQERRVRRRPRSQGRDDVQRGQRERPRLRDRRTPARRRDGAGAGAPGRSPVANRSTSCPTWCP